MLKLLWWCLLLSAIVVCTSGQENEPNSGILEENSNDSKNTSSTVADHDNINNSTTSGGAPVAIPEKEMVKILEKYNTAAAEVCTNVTLASWAVATDVGNKEKEDKKTEEVGKSAKFIKEYYDRYWKAAKNNTYTDPSVRRQLYFLNQLGSSALTPSRLKNLTDTVTGMTSIYNAATVCPYKKPSCSADDPDRLPLDPDISERFAVSRDYDELKYLWVQWHDESGKKIRKMYEDYVTLMNEVGTANGFKNAAELWMDDFEDPDFETHVDELWEQVKPLYEELHTYMRYKLLSIYGDKINRSSENIPAHLLGNMWAQSWENLYEETKPYRGGTVVDVTKRLKELKYDALKMFETANDFYMSLGLPTNNMSYTGKSIITKPANVTIQCHASAWDFCDGKDFRIKMCTNINQEDLIVIHHEMGHIQYYIQYKDQPDTFRKGANPGFHEAIGDTIALSVANPRHLLKIGLIEEYEGTKEDDINALYMEALARVAFLPFGLLIDKWRWHAFNGKAPIDQWNAHWWQLREQYQKISPPVNRTEKDFDPGAKFHVAANSQYISYFISHMLEFAFYKALCIEAGQYDTKNPNVPLHQCDFYKSKAAGKKLADGLKLGASEHWSVALETITGQKNITADAILEYFHPLRKVLVDETKKLIAEDEVRRKLEKYNKEAIPYAHNMKIADWDQATDLNDPLKEEAYVKSVAANAEFTKIQYETNFREYKNKTFIDNKLTRQINLLSELETNALDKTKLTEFTSTVNQMVKIYNTATFCPFNNTNCAPDQHLTLDPEITNIMANSQNYSELEYTWTKWFNLTGPPMKPLFKRYIELNNEAAKLNGLSDAGAMWRARYEDPNLMKNLKAIWKKVEPLYDQLHTYTKNKLSKIYGEKLVDPKSPYIPAHLLGNMWAQSWASLYERIKPFKNGSDLDITTALIRNNYTALKIFEESDRFYQSLGLPSSKMSYTGKSIIEKPTDRLIVCHASAWDFCDGQDFRIKQCTTVNQQNFVTAHHEMGHIQYYILYKDQPLLFRQGANPGFHEAVGDVMALSVLSPSHLKKINLLGDYKDTADDNINALFKMALERVAFLPFGLLIDLYRFDLFAGDIPEEKWNDHWETLRMQYQKIKSPVLRNATHFDAGGKFHVPSDYSYLAYFVAHIAQFQIFRSLCIAAGQYDPIKLTKPLHKCDLQDSKVAGQHLRDGLSLGASEHWNKVLSVITKGETELSADPILEYFQPLHDYLKKVNAEGSDEKPSAGEHSEKSNSKMWWILGGFAILVVVVALIGYAIYYYNRKSSV